MRLFIAINLNEKVLDGICGVMSQLKANITQGKLSSRENLHITLAFLGEIPNSRLEAVKAAMDRVSGCSGFELRISGLGSFKRDGGDIYWLDARADKGHNELHDKLTASLRTEGFELEDKPFQPHLTIGRQVYLPTENREKIYVPELFQHVDKLSLMKSERPGGKLTYTEIYRIDLPVPS